MEDKYFSASLKNCEMLARASSGGAAYAISEYVINHDGAVYGVVYTDDYSEAQYVRADTIEGILAFSGSKYIIPRKMLPNKRNLFESIAQDLAMCKLTLFVGSPCDVSALQTYAMKNEISGLEYLLTIDFICQGPLYPDIQKQYIAFLEKKYRSKLNSFTVRFKKENWTPVYLRATFENGKEHVKPLYETDFGRAFLIYGRECCYQCKNKGDNHVSDITVGDFWGLAQGDKGYNRLGTSVVIIHSEKGERILGELDSITYEEQTKEKATGENPMYSVSRERHEKYYEFEKMYLSKGLHHAVYKTRSILSKIKYWVQLFGGIKPY